MPTPSSGHIDRALTNMSVAFMQDASNFIADKVFPIVPVTKQSDVYFTYSQADFLRDEAKERGALAESAGGDYAISTGGPYYCKVWAFHKDISEQERKNADTPLKPDQDSTEFVSQKLLIRRERDWASKYFTTNVWDTDITGVSADPSDGELLQWNDASSTPITDVADQIITMAGSTGFRPNTLVLSPAVFYALKHHATILDRIKYSQKGIVTTDLLATLFEVERVFIAWAIANTGAKGGTADIDFIFGKSALLCYTAPKPGIKVPSAGYIFAWKGLEGSGAYGNRIVRIPVPLKGLNTERIEGEMAFDARTIASSLGVFFYNIVA